MKILPLVAAVGVLDRLSGSRIIFLFNPFLKPE